MGNFHINFLGNRKYFFILSAILLVVSIGSLAVKGLEFGIDFRGGTSIAISEAGDTTIEQARTAFENAGFDEVNVQTTEVNNIKGYLVRTSVTDATEANDKATVAAKELGMDVTKFSVSTIGAGWGRKLTTSGLTAFAISIIAIILYISIRFEYKMSITAVASLIHDLIITLGMYSLIGAEVSTSTIAALLTIMGYSLYDTIVVFSRIKETTESKALKMSFMSMANISINEVFTRTINTSLTSLIPVVAMLVFNVESLNGFAIALAIGMVVGIYSSIGIAAPLYAMWKEREPKYAALVKRYGHTVETYR